jgi:pilus assembly protein CpaE
VRHNRGQATVELALLLPVLAALMLAVLQVGTVARANVLVGVAANEAARHAAIGDDDATATAAAVRASGLDEARLDVDIAIGSDNVTATATYRDDTTVAVIGRLVAPVTLRAVVVMRREQ